MRRRLFTFALAYLSFLSSIHGQETTVLQTSTPDVKTALTQVISLQLQAFRAGDFVKAYTFASSDIQKAFPPAEFEKMVRTNYPIMVLPTKTDFGVALDDGSLGVVFVQLTVGGANPRGFRYMLKLEATGWKIIGVEQTQDEVAKRPITV